MKIDASCLPPEELASLVEDQFVSCAHELIKMGFCSDHIASAMEVAASYIRKNAKR